MSDDRQSPSPTEEDVASPSLRDRLRAYFVARLGGVIEWSRASRRNMIVAGCTTLGALAVVLAGWSYLAHLAVGLAEGVSVNAALEALDAGNYEQAKHIVGQLQDDAAPDEFGNALYVMGAVKAKEADDEFSAARRRAMHLVAARYLQKAKSLGVDAQRESRLEFLLGRSLILGNQSSDGIALLESVLQEPGMPTGEVHELLAAAYLDAPVPNLQQALIHLENVLADEGLPERLKSLALRQRADVLLRLGRVEPARAAVAAVVEGEARPAEIELLTGRLRLLEATSSTAANDQAALLDQADAALREAIQKDRNAGSTTRQAMYWLGQTYVARGQLEPAIEQFTRLANIYGDSPEGLAAILAAGDLFRETGDIERAQASYRSLLEMAPSPEAYANPLVPLTTMRKQLLAAQQGLVLAEHFEEAVSMLTQLEALFSRQEVVELEAKTLARWGESLLDPLRQTDEWRRDEDRKAGRFYMRSAGRAYEDLARLRAASRDFTDDLWAAAEGYFVGQSYSQAARLYQEYLLHESRSRNGLALLRLGQSDLAIGKYREAVDALSECVEMYPRSEVVFQARLEAARAYRELGEVAPAEELLLTNLFGDSLMTDSPEWRDSIFEIGRLYYDSGRFDEAIKSLQEAVERYPDDEKALLANYTIARASHRAAEAPAERMREAKTENEKQKNRQLMAEFLEQALATYGEVQRAITLAGGGDHNELHRMLLRNCYMMRGAVLFDLRRFDEAREAYSGLSSLYQNDPFVLEIQVQIASCLRRLNEPIKARLAIVQAQQLLASLPPNADFMSSTNFSRQQWELLLDQMAKW